MTKRLSAIIIFSLIIIAILSIGVFAAKTPTDNTWSHRIWSEKNTRHKLAGAEHQIGYAPQTGSQTLGFDEIRSTSPGIQVGITTYDLQSNTRMNRQIDWRNSEYVHMIWMKSTTYELASIDRGTGYEVWDSDEATFVFEGTGGGCDIHARLGPGVNYSGYIGLDVDTEGKVVIANHHDEGAGYASTVWYDFDVAACFFSPYKRPVPDSTMNYGVPPNQQNTDEAEFIWPQHEYQVWNGDTVTHVFSMQFENDIDPSFVHYFRRVGSDTVGAWDYPPMIVDTIPNICQSVAASRVSGKVALIWGGDPGQYPGDPESMTQPGLDPDLGSYQRTLDIFIMVSNDMGANWGSKQNISGYDSTKGGWLFSGDLNGLIDSNDKLHIVAVAREAITTGTSLGEWVNFYGSRLFHWDETTDEWRTVKDANWDITDDAINDSTCTGGAWNNTTIVRPMISECDGKFYTIFTQFLDVPHGIISDCALLRWQGAGYSGTANGEIYISVSDNDGYNWDLARNLTNTPTPLCDTATGTENPCESDHYPSMSRFGMEVVDGDFTGVPVVDPSGSYSGDFYLDVLYINDKFPGSCMQDAGIWTTNPVKWFRVPCVEPVPNPVLTYSPAKIDQPTWTKPTVQLDTVVRLENVGNAPLTINSITVATLPGDPAWLDISNYGPITISHLSPNFTTIDLYMNDGGVVTTAPAVLTGYVIINSNSVGGSIDTLPVNLIVADTVQFPDDSEIRTACVRLSFTNTGDIGDGGSGGGGGYNLNYFNDCDTLENISGADDHAKVYLYDMSPFICMIKSGDTVLNYAMYDATWLSENGFRPLVSPSADSSTYPDYQYGYSGIFVSKDSTIEFDQELFAPTASDSCDFVVLKQRIIPKAAYTG
nr:hypothetical protein [candidate division Zixibacteria bacterium]